MGDVRVLHQEVVVADSSYIAALTSTMDRHAFTKNVPRADADAAWSASIREVLRLIADDRVGMKHVGLAHCDLAQDSDVTYKPCPCADMDRAVEQAKRADFDVRPKLDFGANNRAWMNPGRQRRLVL